jgi:hypothetical protein
MKRKLQLISRIETKIYCNKNWTLDQVPSSIYVIKPKLELKYMSLKNKELEPEVIDSQPS